MATKKTTAKKATTKKATATKSRAQKAADAVNKKNTQDYKLQNKYHQARSATKVTWKGEKGKTAYVYDKGPWEDGVLVTKPKKVTPKTKSTAKKTATPIKSSATKAITRGMSKKKKSL